MAKKKAAKKKSARKPNAAFMKALTPSADLAAVIGNKAVPRTDAVKKIQDELPQIPEIKEIVSFIGRSKRGLATARKH